MAGHVLQTTQKAKYLGLTVTPNLSWNTHIDNITCKANKTLGFVRRNIKVSSHKIKSLVYIFLVRPFLKYSSPVLLLGPLYSNKNRSNRDGTKEGS